MVAGHLAMEVCGPKEDAVRPAPAWFMFVKTDKKKAIKRLKDPAA